MTLFKCDDRSDIFARYNVGMSFNNSAIEDFHRARRKAMMEQVLARLTGQSADLLSFEEVRRRLRANRQVDLGLQAVPLDAIVGSVGRYRDFTRTFLPKESTNQQRWAQVMYQNTDGMGLPPIDLYKIGDAYFVLDGNHRVSVARELDADTIQAYVIEVVSKVPFTADMNPDKLIIAQQYLNFVEQTTLDEVRPQADLQVTVPGKYQLLLDHIETHRYFMGLDEQRDIEWVEAVAHWFDQVYLPVVALIREKGIMRDFPERTETDFYIWLADHRADIEKALGWGVSTERAVDALVEVKRPLLTRVNDLIWEQLGIADPEELATPKRWALIEDVDRFAQDKGLRAGENIMVNIDGRHLDWTAVEQAILIAKREKGRVHALYFAVGADDETQTVVRERFETMLVDADLLGQIAVIEEDGAWQRHMLERSRWNDLVILGVGAPDSPLWGRPWRQIAIRCARPVLLVSDVVSPLNKILLAYDGRKYANQALAISAYLANIWQIPLVILYVGPADEFDRLQGAVDAYLVGHNVAAIFVNHQGDLATNLLLTAEDHKCDVIVLGTYSHTPVLEMVRGTAVNKMLRHGGPPILICQ